MSEHLVRILVDAGAEHFSAQRTAMFIAAGCSIREAAEWLELDDAIDEHPEIVLLEALLTEHAQRPLLKGSTDGQVPGLRPSDNRARPRPTSAPREGHDRKNPGNVRDSVRAMRSKNVHELRAHVPRRRDRVPVVR